MDSKFQPTRPLRGATISTSYSILVLSYFNPRAPCGARQHGLVFERFLRKDFNPRAPCGARPKCNHTVCNTILFQPTRPLRGATVGAINPSKTFTHISTHAPLAGRDYGLHASAIIASEISTHAPLAGRDSILFYILTFISNFNPRAPCGARQQKCTNHYAHFCDNRQISDAFAQNAACQGILLLFDAGKSCGFWVRTAQVISAHLCFAL